MSQSEGCEKEEELGLQGVLRAWERSGGWVGGCLEWVRGRYLRSLFARHPWHSPFSLKEETRETMRRGPVSGPQGLGP